MAEIFLIDVLAFESVVGLMKTSVDNKFYDLCMCDNVCRYTVLCWR